MEGDKILELGRAEDWKSLSDLLLSSDTRELIKFTKSSLVKQDGSNLLRFMMTGLGSADSTNQVEEVRFRVVETVVKQICENMSIPNRIATDMMDTLGVEMEKFTSNTLVSLLDKIMEQLERSEESVTSFRWLPLLARLLAVVEGRESVTVDDVQEEGSAFKSRMIRQMTDLKWGREIITPLCSMMKDVKLTKDELSEVLDKFCTSLTNLPAEDVPPLVYQLLLLTRTLPNQCDQLLATLNSYFTPEGRADKTNVDLDSIDSIEESNASTEEEMQQAGSNVVFHITQATRLGHPVAKQLIKLVKSSTHAPEIVLNNFSLFMCLAVTSVKQWRASLLESLRQTVSRWFLLEEKRQSSAWLRVNLPKTGDVSEILGLVISQSSKFGGWELIVEGLVELGLALLDIQPQLGKIDKRLRSIHHLGARILFKVVKKQGADLAKEVIGPLTERVVNNHNSCQYTDALRVIIRDTATILMENPGVVNSLVDNLTGLSFQSGRRSLIALMPLVRFSRTLRDQIILALRKALFARAVSSRQTGVTGVLLLLRTFKLSTNFVGSQLSQSSGSLTQLAVEVHRGGTQGAANNNDALCTELLGVLKRCFSLQPQVRLTLYQGLNEVIAKNPELCEGALELVYIHMLDLLGLSEDAWELNLNKTVVGQVRGDQCNGIEEPAGWFLHCVVILVGRAQQLLEEEGVDILDKLARLLDNMTNGYSTCNISELGFEVTDNYNIKTPDGEQRSLKMDVLLTIYEALMEYVISHGADSNKEKAETLLKLQSNHSALKIVRSSALARKVKTGKKGSNKEGKDDGDKTKDGNDDGPSKRGRSGASKDDGQFLMPKYALSMKSLSILLKAMVDDGGLLFEDSSFCHFLIEIITEKINQISIAMSQTGDEGPQSDILFRYLTNLTTSLFKQSVEKSDDILSLLTTPCLLQVLKLLLTLFPRRRLNLFISLSDSINPENSTEDNLNPVLVPVMKLVMKNLANLKESFLETAEDDIADRLATSVEIFSLLMGFLNEKEGVEDVRTWIKMLCDNMDTAVTKVLEPLVRLRLTAIVKLKEKHHIGLEMARQFHNLTGDVETQVQVEEVSTLSWLNNNNKDTIFPLLMDHLETILDHCDLAIYWMKAMTNPNKTNNNLSTAEASLCMVFSRQVNAATELVRTAFPLGSSVEAVLKYFVKMYTVTGNLTKHFILRVRHSSHAAQAANFDKLIKLMNSQLTKFVYDLITFIENKQKERDLQAAAARANKKKTLEPNLARAKVLRESRHIPNLILKVEMMDKDIIKLGKRIGQNLGEGSRATVSRDFRIKISEELEERMRDESSDDEESGDETTTHEPVMGDITNSTQGDGVSQGPSAKKSKLSLSVMRKENKAI